MSPRIVRTEGVKTPRNVPNFLTGCGPDLPASALDSFGLNSIHLSWRAAHRTAQEHSRPMEGENSTIESPRVVRSASSMSQSYFDDRREGP
jgi:hypothetical protein